MNLKNHVFPRQQFYL